MEAQYVAVEDEEQLTGTSVAALQDNGNNSTSKSIVFAMIVVCTHPITTNLCVLRPVNIQQITEISSETHNAVTSMIAMAPGTVTVVQQVNKVTSRSSRNHWMDTNIY